MDVKIIVIVGILLSLAACGKLGISGIASQALGDWAEVKLPPGCAVKQVAAEESSGVVVLCEDGRVFH